MNDDILEDARIPKNYRKSGLRRVETVGELIKHLQNLPSDLKMDYTTDIYVSKVINKPQRFVCCIKEFNE